MNKPKIKFFFGVGVLTLFFVSLFSCYGKGQIRIGVSSANFNDVFLNTVVQAMREEADKHDGVDLVVQDSSEDVSKQIAHVENFITQKFDAIIVIPVDTAAMRPITQKAVDAKTTLVYINRRPQDFSSNPYTYYIGSNEKQAGLEQMEYLARMANYQGNVAILVGRLGNEGARKRTEGVHEIVNKYPNMQVVFEQTGNWQRSEAVSLIENLLTSGRGIDIIASNNDDMALGAASVIDKQGLKDSILIGGVDATSDGVMGILSGALTVTMFQNAKRQGSEGVSVALKSLNHEMMAANEVIIPFELVHLENIQDYE